MKSKIKNVILAAQILFVLLLVSAGEMPAYASFADDTGRPTRKSLVERYGEEAVKKYEQRFEDWSCKQHKVNIDAYKAISDWMQQDKVPLYSDVLKNRSEMDEIMQQIWAKFCVDYRG